MLLGEILHRDLALEQVELEVEAQVGLVRAVATHRVGVRDPRERPGQLDVDEPPQLGVDLLGERDDVVAYLGTLK